VTQTLMQTSQASTRAPDVSSKSGHVVVLCWHTPSASDRRALEIAMFLGATASFATITGDVVNDLGSIRTAVPRGTCLVVHAETLARAADAARAGAGVVQALTSDLAEYVFVHGFEPADSHNAVLRSLTSNALHSVQRAPGPTVAFQVAAGRRTWCGPFSGLSFDAEIASGENLFIPGLSSAQLDVLARAGGQPFFARTVLGAAQVFVVSSRDLADLDERVESTPSPLSWFSRAIPLMMFLRGSLGRRVWHPDTPRACFIIDDPTLRKRYGFLEYRRLVDSMRRNRFSTCIAFIPWNYRRSRRDAATLWSSGGRVPGLCVHGCDHTWGEFAIADGASLHGKARLALERMRAHHRLSGVPFDDVMVFPQGLFSVEAMAALERAGYLAAVNTDLFPARSRASMALRDLLDVAVVRLGGCPLFGRRYPGNLAAFAFDLFLGKPAIAVEHHGYFRHGYAALESFVHGLNGLDDRLEWTNLGTICSRACLTRTDAQGDVHVRFFTRRFQLTNTAARAQRYQLFRPHPVAASLPAMFVNGRAWTVERQDDSVKLILSVDPGQTVDIGLAEAEEPVASPWQETGLHNARVRIRRLLCEFRHNHVDTNGILHAVATTARCVRPSSRTAAPPAALERSR
jgi:hypothetical protein